MSDDSNKKEEKKTVFKLSDDTIAAIRELIQLSLLTGTSVVDHLRGLRLEQDEKSFSLLPTEEWVLEYNKTIRKLEEQAREAALKAQKTLVTTH